MKKTSHLNAEYEKKVQFLNIVTRVNKTYVVLYPPKSVLRKLIHRYTTLYAVTRCNWLNTRNKARAQVISKPNRNIFVHNESNSLRKNTEYCCATNYLFSKDKLTSSKCQSVVPFSCLNCNGNCLNIIVKWFNKTFLDKTIKIEIQLRYRNEMNTVSECIVKTKFIARLIRQH